MTTLMHDIGLAGRDLASISKGVDEIAATLAELLNHITGRDRALPPRPFSPADGDDTYSRALATLMSLQGRTVEAMWAITGHPSVIVGPGELTTADIPAGDCDTGFNIGDGATFWVDRHELLNVKTFDCGCAWLLTVGGAMAIKVEGCERVGDHFEER
jgi:hypothetical protein